MTKSRILAKLSAPREGSRLPEASGGEPPARLYEVGSDSDLPIPPTVTEDGWTQLPLPIILCKRSQIEDGQSKYMRR